MAFQSLWQEEHFLSLLAVFGDLSLWQRSVSAGKELMDSIRLDYGYKTELIKIVSDAVILSVFASLVSWINCYCW